MKDILCRAAEEQAAVCLEHSPLLLPAAAPAPRAQPEPTLAAWHVPAGQSWLPRPRRFTPTDILSLPRCRAVMAREESWTGVSYSLDQQIDLIWYTQKMKLSLPVQCRVRIALWSAAVEEAVLPPAKNHKGLCLHQCSCEVPQMQASC